MRAALVSILVLLAAACAPACATTPAPQAGSGDGLVCVEKQVTGSRIPQEVCETPAEAERRTASDQRELNRLPRTTPPGPITK